VRGELAIILKIANSLAEDLKMGPVRELIISFDAYSIISLMIRDNYALILFLDDSASLGLARKKMGAVIPELEKELYPE
jgi:predicted regulator of Ras-like GTPase activity (Roadblock/LC7/MglB family)